MLLSCIRQKPVTSWRSNYGCDINEIFSMPFGDDLCERCVQIKAENVNNNNNSERKMTNSSNKTLLNTKCLSEGIFWNFYGFFQTNMY